MKDAISPMFYTPHNLPLVFYTGQLCSSIIIHVWSLSRFEFWPLNYPQILSGKKDPIPVCVLSPRVHPCLNFGLFCPLVWLRDAFSPGLQGRDDSEPFLSWLLISVKMLLREALSSSYVLTSLLQIKSLTS